MAESVSSPKWMQIPLSELRYHWKPDEEGQRGDEARRLDSWRQRKRNEESGPRESVGVTLTATMVSIRSLRRESGTRNPRQADQGSASEDGWRAEGKRGEGSEEVEANAKRQMSL
ncbi:hypothetical protein BO94DRAFT_27031 [Aspergillus sclerotioniger CBS 115572]|uniref:Uncharacterized protein n=1 Tax=Aspergillus sclerotioniger CBS 115572 TaxID=1450535 RepID=A0A317WVQ8_9EURO|nr:hypothetical protein BO94DRAFT_27031 [Aspergillus sclerotioniger CBS 115572]PWY90494.1 hypothetical protein BO94DRAFT_27031 [Aspergillus sclerotioniger CBS 115572]